ncbi:MAG: PEP-utilizing enzyme, partial [Brasilonema sp.]
LPRLLQHRQTQFQHNQELSHIPYVIYGNPTDSMRIPTSSLSTQRRLQGIGASPGRVEGRIKVLRDFRAMTDIDRQTILVVPYTDSGWAPLLARAGGLIAEVGGRLSHGAIIAREYGIPAVMDIHHATQWLQDGQRVRIDGQIGIVEILES